MWTRHGLDVDPAWTQAVGSTHIAPKPRVFDVEFDVHLSQSKSGKFTIEVHYSSIRQY